MTALSQNGFVYRDTIPEHILSNRLALEALVYFNFDLDIGLLFGFLTLNLDGQQYVAVSFTDD